MSRNQEVAATIINQMGGVRRLSLMTGAKDFVAIEDGVRFSLPRTAAIKGINLVEVTLNGSDLYDMRFMRYRAADCVTVSQVEDVYFDQLEEIFTQVTGLLTRL